MSTLLIYLAGVLTTPILILIFIRFGSSHGDSVDLRKNELIKSVVRSTASTE